MLIICGKYCTECSASAVKEIENNNGISSTTARSVWVVTQPETEKTSNQPQPCGVVWSVPPELGVIWQCQRISLALALGRAICMDVLQAQGLKRKRRMLLVPHCLLHHVCRRTNTHIAPGRFLRTVGNQPLVVAHPSQSSVLLVPHLGCRGSGPHLPRITRTMPGRYLWLGVAWPWRKLGTSAQALPADGRVTPSRRMRRTYDVCGADYPRHCLVRSVGIRISSMPGVTSPAFASDFRADHFFA